MWLKKSIRIKKMIRILKILSFSCFKVGKQISMSNRLGLEISHTNGRLGIYIIYSLKMFEVSFWTVTKNMMGHQNEPSPILKFRWSLWSLNIWPIQFQTGTPRNFQTTPMSIIANISPTRHLEIVFRGTIPGVQDQHPGLTGKTRTINSVTPSTKNHRLDLLQVS